MAKRRVPLPGGDKGYTVGYCKPPMHSRFQPGQSGYPVGRRKGVRNLKTDVKRTLLKPVKYKEVGRTHKKSTQEVILLVLREKALQGDQRAIDRIVELALRFNNEFAEAAAAQPLPADDQAILDAYAAERATAVMKPAGRARPDDPAGNPGGRSRKLRSR